MTDLPEMFEKFRVDAWRLEARDYYDVPEYQDSLAAYQAGRPLPRREDGWLPLVARVRARGARIGRTRLVGHPTNAYTRWEFTQYAENVATGEDVRILDRDDAFGRDLPDVWLFDDEVAFVQHYGDEGAYLGADQVDPAPYVELRQTLERRAIPFADYARASLPEKAGAYAISPEQVYADTE
jgi:hypothetical protein